MAAIARAQRHIAGLRGEFLGDGPERAALRTAISEHGVSESVSAPGFADGTIVDAEMRRALCVLLPSRREGYGMVVVEAAARGTPSVVVAGEDNAATELIVEDVNGFISPSSDPDAIAEAIVRVSQAGFALRERTAAWYRENAQRLSLESSLRISCWTPTPARARGRSSRASSEPSAPT